MQPLSSSRAHIKDLGTDSFFLNLYFPNSYQEKGWQSNVSRICCVWETLPGVLGKHEIMLVR